MDDDGSEVRSYARSDARSASGACTAAVAAVSGRAPSCRRGLESEHGAMTGFSVSPLLAADAAKIRARLEASAPTLASTRADAAATEQLSKCSMAADEHRTVSEGIGIVAKTGTTARARVSPAGELGVAQAADSQPGSVPPVQVHSGAAMGYSGRICC